MNEFKKNIFKKRTTDNDVVISIKSVSLGYAATIGSDACLDFDVSPITRYIPISEGGFLTTSLLYQNSKGTILAQAGYYSDGAKWRYWNESIFTSEGFC